MRKQSDNWKQTLEVDDESRKIFRRKVIREKRAKRNSQDDKNVGACKIHEDEAVFNDEDEKVFELKETLNGPDELNSYPNTPLRNVKMSSPKSNVSSIMKPKNLLNNVEPRPKNLNPVDDWWKVDT